MRLVDLSMSPLLADKLGDEGFMPLNNSEKIGPASCHSPPNIVAGGDADTLVKSKCERDLAGLRSWMICSRVGRVLLLDRLPAVHRGVSRGSGVGGSNSELKSRS